MRTVNPVSAVFHQDSPSPGGTRQTLPTRAFGLPRPPSGGAAGVTPHPGMPLAALGQDVAQQGDLVGHDAVRAQVQRPLDLRLRVQGPYVDLQAELVRAPDEGPVGDLRWHLRALRP